MSIPSTEASAVDAMQSYAHCISAAVFAPAAHNALKLQEIEQRLIPGASFSQQLRDLARAEGDRGYVPTELDPEDWGRESIGADLSPVAKRRQAAVTALSRLAIEWAPSGWLHSDDALLAYQVLANTLRRMCGQDEAGAAHAKEVMADIRLGLVQASTQLSSRKHAVDGYGVAEAQNAVEQVWPAIGGRNFHFAPKQRRAV